MPSSERLFNILLYALWVTPAAVVVTWVVWRVVIWCHSYTALVSAWVGRLPAILRPSTRSPVQANLRLRDALGRRSGCRRRRLEMAAGASIYTTQKAAAQIRLSDRAIALLHGLKTVHGVETSRGYR